MRVSRALGVAIWAGALAITTASCAPDQFVDRTTLQNDPAAQLRFAGVLDLGEIGGERGTTLDGAQPAFTGGIFGTAASDTEVMSYFDGELKRLGWGRDDASALRSTVELRAWAWCKPTMNFRLAIEDQARAFQPDFYKGNKFTTVFTAQLVSRNRALSCP